MHTHFKKCVAKLTPKQHSRCLNWCLSQTPNKFWCRTSAPLPNWGQILAKNLLAPNVADVVYCMHLHATLICNICCNLQLFCKPYSAEINIKSVKKHRPKLALYIAMCRYFKKAIKKWQIWLNGMLKILEKCF